MNKVAIIVLADAETPVDRGRMIHALTAVKELKDANDDVQLIFEGIGVRWVSAFADTQDNFTQHYHDLYNDVKDKIGGVCNFCAGRFEVREVVESQNIAYLGVEGNHQSLRELIAQGYQIVTF
jgi:hypothetical protein